MSVFCSFWVEVFSLMKEAITFESGAAGSAIMVCEREMESWSCLTALRTGRIPLPKVDAKSSVCRSVSRLETRSVAVASLAAASGRWPIEAIEVASPRTVEIPFIVFGFRGAVRRR